LLSIKTVVIVSRTSYVEGIEWVKGKNARIKRNLGNGYETVEARLPLLLTVVSSANTPRPPRAKLLLQYFPSRTSSELLGGDSYTKLEDLKERDLLIEEWGAGELTIDKNRIGISGSPTRVKKIENIILTAKGFKEFKPTEGDIQELMREFSKEHTFD